MLLAIAAAHAHPGRTGSSELLLAALFVLLLSTMFVVARIYSKRAIRVSVRPMLLIAALLIPSAKASAQSYMGVPVASQSDVEKIVQYMFNHSAASRLISYEKMMTDSSRQVVFVHEGMRYTIYVSGPKGFISFWVRKDGTSAQRDMVTFSDMNRDGIVDFGVEGAGGGKLYHGKDDAMGKPSGEQYRDYWQRQYNAAVAATLAFYEGK